ncbi:hypothetical protein [Streptomyces sp. NBC_01373]|uniref:hypothetical protein n=1 Tax=Streptomyces sp. NBC_01373 TaxID=2903843 RepID=UPI002256D3A9|nr:hypothetical protein [Streptomyces sp. NBC_01373]MCX4700100.1 hypothetical protein [Streptomyces sp. NBC_01373]
MSVTLIPGGVSNPGLKPWVITVLVVIVIVWGVAANVVSAYTDVLALVTTLYAGSAVQQRSTATVRTDVDRL